jgi:MFS family permease
MLAFGQLLSVASTKWVYMLLICIFEIGSLLCGVAPSMNILILGRAIAGVGAAGIFVSVFVIVSQITRLEQRPLLFGLFGGIYAVSSVVGPLLGGAFTDKVTWRWCFYSTSFGILVIDLTRNHFLVNLPIGGVAVAFIGLFLKAQPAPSNSHFPRPGWRKYLDLDWIGAILCIGMTTSLLLPLQEGGNTKPWSDPTVYALFPVFAVLFVAFIAWEWRMGPRAMMPFDMFKHKTQSGCCLEAVSHGSHSSEGSTQIVT